MENIIKKWKDALNDIQQDIMPSAFSTWIEPLVPMAIDADEGSLILSTSNEMSRSILQGRYLPVIKQAVSNNFSIPLEIKIVLSNEEIPAAKGSSKSRKAGSDPSNEEIFLNPKYNFSTFVVGANNELAHAAAQAVAKNLATAYNPLFLYGKSGLGKTHLMHAVGHYVMQNNPTKRVLYVSSESFTNELVNAIQSKKNEEFRKKYRNIDLLMIDDIQFIEKKDATQEELFHTFESLYGTNKQIIFCSDRPPKEIQTIDARLKSRFEWGLTVDIQSPDFETRVAILKNKAEMEDIFVNDDLLEIFYLIADKITSNIRELEGALNRVIAHANLMNKPLTKETAKEVLSGVFDTSSRTIDAPLIKTIVCSHFSINVADIESSKRTKNLAHPRQIAMYLCRELTELSLPNIGKYFGNRDHTTVMHACDKISNDMLKDENLRNTISELKLKIKDE